MDYRVVEITWRSGLPFLSRILLFLFGAFLVDLRPESIGLEVEVTLNQMARQNYLFVSQITNTGRNKAVLLIFARERGGGKVR